MDVKWGSFPSKKCLNCKEDVEDYWKHGVCPEIADCGCWKHKLFFAALRGEIQQVNDPWKSDPGSNYTNEMLLAAADMSDFFVSRPFGLGIMIDRKLCIFLIIFMLRSDYILWLDLEFGIWLFYFHKMHCKQNLYTKRTCFTSTCWSIDERLYDG